MRLEPLIRKAMPVSLRPKRSAGVRVAAPVFRQIQTGNAAREGRSWAVAAQAYEAAVLLDPSLTHIWIQLGHACKELGELGKAADAYRQAQRLSPASGEPHLHLGHVAKERGDLSGAIRHYVDAARAQPPARAAIEELSQQIAKGAKIDMDQVMQLLDRGPSPSSGRAEHHPGRKTTVESGTALIFDISDLIAYFRHARTPSGIQRVQVEVLREAFALESADVRLCLFQEARDEWVELPREQFEHLCALSDVADDAEWAPAIARVTIQSSIAEPLAFPKGALLINLGTSWWIPNYFLYVRRAQETAGIRYVPFVHDMIPLIRPDVCPPLLVRDFTAWAASVLEHADFYLVNSNSTKRDLMGVSAYLGQPIAGDRIEVVPLDAIHAVPERRQAGASVVNRNGLRRSDYVLFVSTIEPRKNHLAVFDAWLKLMERHGKKKIPPLVCVGNQGWMNEPIHDFLKARPDLRMKVIFLSHLSDAELAELYRNCAFTLYPSLYEGWGLPVTESLSHGKVALCSNSSSLPQAGGEWADYFDVDNRGELIAGIERLLFDRSYRTAREESIAAGFKPRRWADVAPALVAGATGWSASAPERQDVPPRVDKGRYYALSRNLAPTFWPGLRSTERLRSGTNWWGRDEWGCWTKPGGAALAYRLDRPDRHHRLYLRLLGMPHVSCPLQIDVAGSEKPLECVLQPNETRWVCVEIPAVPLDDPVHRVTLRCETFEDLGKTTNSGDTRLIAVGVIGLFLCEAEDAASRMALLEATTLTSIDSLSINRPPADFVPLAGFLERWPHD